MEKDERRAWVRRAIGGDGEALAWVAGQSDHTDDIDVLVVAALGGARTDLLDRAAALATTSRDRQLVAIAAAHAAGNADLVDMLARDHLAAYPDSVLVAWIAAGAS